MCIILYKKTGVKLPDKEIIKNCMENNPDGAGYMFSTGNYVKIKKGFFKHDHLLGVLQKDLKAHSLKETDTPIVIHARITTQGMTKPQNCHPFPVTKSVGELQKLSIKCQYAIAHNGIISIKDNDFPNISDTMLFVKDVLSKVDFLSNKGIDKLIDLSLNNSRMIIFDKFGVAKSFGDWEKEDDVYYSNDSYEAKKWGKVYSRGSWNKSYASSSYTPYSTTGKDEDTKKSKEIDRSRCIYCEEKLIYSNEIATNVCFNCMDTSDKYSGYDRYMGWL